MPALVDGIIEHLRDAPSRLPPGTAYGFVRVVPTQGEFPPDRRLSGSPYHPSWAVPYDRGWVAG